MSAMVKNLPQGKSTHGLDEAEEDDQLEGEQFCHCIPGFHDGSQSFVEPYDGHDAGNDADRSDNADPEMRIARLQGGDAECSGGFSDFEDDRRDHFDHLKRKVEGSASISIFLDNGF